MSNQLLIIEDDPGIQRQLRWAFEDYDVHIADNSDAALDFVGKHKPPVITLDLGLPPDPANASVGMELLENILKISPYSKIIVVTGNDDESNAIKAVGLGAYDFYQKPIDPDLLGLIINRANRLYELESENRKLNDVSRHSVLDGIIATSPQMLKVCRQVEKVAPTNVTTLILGESGTGKEIIARAIHNLSDRRDKPFIAINSAAIPENLLESELFGYEKGAFTGATKQTKGKLEYAHEATFFLDEVGDLPAALQAKILRFLQERVIERVGGRKEIPIDVRVICATHRDLDVLIRENLFREDLYYRISEVSIRLPSLREREGDALLLARVFLEKFAAQNNKQVKGFSPQATALIESYSWPGNVRELENKIKRAVIMAEDKLVTEEDLDINGEPQPQEISLNLRQIREAAESKAINRALSISGNSMSKAAEILGISRPTLYDLMNKLGLK